MFIETNNTCLSEKILNPKLSILLIRARNELNHELDFTSHTRVDLWLGSTNSKNFFRGHNNNGFVKQRSRIFQKCLHFDVFFFLSIILGDNLKMKFHYCWSDTWSAIPRSNDSNDSTRWILLESSWVELMYKLDSTRLVQSSTQINLYS